MSTKWSTKIQGINTLNLNRSVRFTDKTFKNILNVIDVKTHDKIIEFGCGPGTFTRRLSHFHPSSSITGLDFDSNFIKFCKEEAKKEKLENVDYIQGNALKTSFDDESFDICTSHTVIEHLPNKEFLEEQYRLLKPGGKLVVLNVRGDFSLRSTEGIEQCQREKDLFEKVNAVLENLQSHNKVGQYAANPQEILQTIESVGYKNIELEVIPYVICIDDQRHEHDYKIQVLNSEKNMIIEFVMMAVNNNIGALSEEELNELLSLIENRHNKRIEMIKEKKTLWDFSILPTLVMTAMKPFL